MLVTLIRLVGYGRAFLISIAMQSSILPVTGTWNPALPFHPAVHPSGHTFGLLCIFWGMKTCQEWHFACESQTDMLRQVVRVIWNDGLKGRP